MNMNDKRKRTVAIIGSALALSGIGGGLALAAGGSSQPSTQPATPPVTQTAPQASTVDVPTPGDQADTPSKDALTPGDRPDTRPDRETADVPGQEGVENPGAETANEGSEPANERAMEPANGHEDSGPNVDHQFEGVE